MAGTEAPASRKPLATAISYRHRASGRFFKNPAVLIKEALVPPFAENWFTELVGETTETFEIRVPVNRSSLSIQPRWVYMTVDTATHGGHKLGSFAQFPVHFTHAVSRTLLAAFIAVVVCPWYAAGSTGDAGHLVCPVKDNWDDKSQECPCKEWTPSQAQILGMIEEHQKWFLHVRGDFKKEGRAVFCNATFYAGPSENGPFKNARLQYGNFEGADLFTRFARSSRSKHSLILHGADFSGSLLQGADFRNAVVKLANFRNANLSDASFENAELMLADFGNAKLHRTKLSGANFNYVNLSEASYAPLSQPSPLHLIGITGLSTVRFPEGNPVGLVQLRHLLRQGGLDSMERQVTYALEHLKAFHARTSCPPRKWFRFSGSESGCSPGVWVGGIARLVFFEWTTNWGLNPGRALAIALAITAFMGPIYGFAVASGRNRCLHTSGIYRVLPEGRVEPALIGITIAKNPKVETISASVPLAIVWGFYFSILTTFHIGWRDVNLGAWIARMQFKDYALLGRGWVRLISGVQSLISVCLLAIWALTYFGRPFQQP